MNVSKKDLTFEEVLEIFDPNKHVFICSKSFYDSVGVEHEEIKKLLIVDEFQPEKTMYLVEKESLYLPDLTKHKEIKNSLIFDEYQPKYTSRINEINGNLVEAVKIGKLKKSITVHGCNCLGIMGAGIAAQFKEHLPEVYLQYKLAYLYKSEKFGEPCSLPLGSAQTVSTNFGNYVINGMTQQNVGKGIQVDYDAVRNVFKQVNELANMVECHSINFPLIGCGLAGGDWNIVSKIIEEEIDEQFILNLWVYNG